MTTAPLLPHSWDLGPAAAIALQKQLAGLVVAQNQLGTPRLVAGVDVGFPGGGDVTRAAVAVLTAVAARAARTASGRYSAPRK